MISNYTKIIHGMVILIALLLAACGGGSGGGTAVSSDATLSSLYVNPWPIYPAFSPATVAYNNPLPATFASVSVEATVADANATMTINGTAVVSDILTLTPVSVPVGQSTITIVVTAQDGITTKSYVITVTRSDIDLSPPVSLITAFHSVTMTVTLETVPSTDTVVTLTSSAPSVVTVPANVTVLAGATQASFSATSVASGAGLGNVFITATLGSDFSGANLMLQ
jgi:hypothetical protein